MDRYEMLDRIEARRRPWDFIVIGGGAAGLGTALEAASRGYSTLLLEQSDFAKGTSGRGSKLTHGGGRTPQQGNVALVLEALRERGLLMRNASHLVRNRSFIAPITDSWEGPFFGIGLKVYDTMAGSIGLGPSRVLSREEALEHIPGLHREGLQGGVIYQDGQFDDARLAIALARTLVEREGAAVNYMQAVGLLHRLGLVCGVQARDLESGRQYRLRARVVINATGVHADAVRTMDDPRAEPIVAPCREVRLILGREFLPGENGILAPDPEDGRLLLAVPWHGRVVIGTARTPVDEIPLEPRASAPEIESLLSRAARYLTRRPEPGDVLSVVAGLQPLPRAGRPQSESSPAREYIMQIARSGLITILGGTWTIYRKMGEDVVNEAAAMAGLEERSCMTRELRLHGWQAHSREAHPWRVFGTDAAAVKRLAEEDWRWREPLHPRLPGLMVQVLWAVRHEMARTVEDVLARRTRSLLIDARASIEAAPRVAELMAPELGQDGAWQAGQVAAYAGLAGGYLPD